MRIMREYRSEARTSYVRAMRIAPPPCSLDDLWILVWVVDPTNGLGGGQALGLKQGE